MRGGLSVRISAVENLKSTNNRDMDSKSSRRQGAAWGRGESGFFSGSSRPQTPVEPGFLNKSMRVVVLIFAGTSVAVTCKLFGLVSWHWLWVLSPLWGGIALMILSLIILAIFVSQDSGDL